MTTTTATKNISAADKILAAYTADPNKAFTAKELVTVTGLSRTTVNDNLRKLAEAGAVIRFDGQSSQVSTWSLTPTRKAALKRAAAKAAKASVTTRTPAKGKTATSPKGKATVTDSAETPTRTETGRRVKGAIDNEIIAFFENNNNEPTGSYGVANGIGSSKGAAYVATKRMAAAGTLVLVSQEPDRFALPAA